MLRSVPALLLLLAGAAQAANLNFNGAAVTGCTYANGTQTYRCTSPSLGPNDSAIISSGYTVIVSLPISFTSGQGLTMSGTAKLQTSGSDAIDLSGSQNINITGGTLVAGGNFRLGSNAQSITANVSAASVTTAGSSTNINGTVTATGAINLGSNSTITGAVSAGSLTTGSSINLGPLTVSGAVNLGSSNTINGAISAASITTNSSVSMGALSITGAINLGSSNTVNGNVSGASIITNSSVTINGSVSTPGGTADLGSGIKISGGVTAGTVKTNSPGQIGGAIVSAGTVDLGSGITVGGNVSGTTITANSPVSITGNVNASTSFTLGSGGSVTGNITAPVVTLSPSGITVKGNIAASTSLDIGSGTTVNGNTSGGSLIMRPSGITINGNATFTGDVDMGSGSTINGDLAARNVTTRASGAVINGNAAVNSIYIDWGNSVSKTITCTGSTPSAPTCSCVTKADSNYQPTCGAAQAAGPHHIQISHSGNALTCQPQTVTLTACANAACTAPHYSTSTAVTLLPGGKQFTVTGGVNSAATVEQSMEGKAALSATSNAANAFTCVNSGDAQSPCDMVFKKSGLVVTAANHISMDPNATVSIKALTASATNQSCVPLVAGKQVNVQMACAYSDPVSGTVQPRVGTTDLTCNGGTTAVPISFDNNGAATVALAYADVGMVDLKASYTSSAGGTAFNADGSDSFIAAPKEFKVVAISDVTNVSTAATHDIFAKASETFTVTVTAVNTMGNVVKNFGQEQKKEGVSFGYQVLNPSDSSNNGILATGEFLPFKDGVYTSKTGSLGKWSFDDVGTVNLTLTLANAANNNATTYYMGATDAGFATKGALSIARFIPDHFDTVLIPDRTMDCKNLLPASINPCAGTSTRFTHSKQAFLLKVLAYNGAATPALTSNYAGTTLSKPITLSAWDAPGGDKAIPNFALTWTAPNPADAAASAARKFTFTAGTGTGVLTNQTGTSAILPTLSFSSAYPANDILPATVYLRAVDSDGVSSKRSVATSSVEAPLTVVSGRLLLSNAYGSQNSPLPVDASAQYYMPSGYVFNPQVQVVSVTKIASKITFTACQNKLDTGGGNCPATLKVANDDFLTLLNGKATFRLAPPTPALSGNGSANVSLGLLFDYLPSSTGRATFGIYRSGPVIYTREVHN